MKKILIISVLFFLRAISAYAEQVDLAWDANPIDEPVAGYKVYWGPQSRMYTEALDVAGLLYIEVIDSVRIVNVDRLNIPYGSFIAVTAYGSIIDESGNFTFIESGFSNEVFFTFVPSATGGRVFFEWKQPELFKEDFNGYPVDADPTGWVDTSKDNSMMTNNDLFKVDVEHYLESRSSDINIHSHYIGSSFSIPFIFAGKMKKSAGGGVGVTFLSDYPDSDTYYRLRAYGDTSFHIAPHPHGINVMQGTVDSGVIPDSNIWYDFVIKTESYGDRIQIYAKIWKTGESEPQAWQISCYQLFPFLENGKIGIWSMAAEGNGWDDFLIY